MSVQKIEETTVSEARLNEASKSPNYSLHEDVERFGLDPDLYVGVVSAELGKAGVVNRNERIYRVEEFVEQNIKLANRINDGFVDGELGHPEAGPTFRVPAQLIQVETVTQNNTALALGKFAILNTSIGKDVLTLFKAGMEVGTSSRGSGVVDEMVLDEDSEFAAANPSFIGKRVKVVSDFMLDTYDLVRVPSAGTRVLSIDEATDIGDATKEQKMAENIKPEADVTAAQDVFTNLEESKRAVLMKILEAVSLDEAPSDNRLAKEVAAIREQMEVDRERATINEHEYTNLREEVQKLRVEKAAREKADGLNRAISEATDGRRFGNIVRSELEAVAAALEVDEIAGRAERLFSMIESTHTPIANPVEQVAVDVADDLAEAVETEAVETILPTKIDEQLRRILGIN